MCLAFFSGSGGGFSGTPAISEISISWNPTDIDGIPCCLGETTANGVYGTEGTAEFCMSSSEILSYCEGNLSYETLDPELSDETPLLRFFSGNAGGICRGETPACDPGCQSGAACDAQNCPVNVCPGRGELDSTADSGKGLSMPEMCCGF